MGETVINNGDENRIPHRAINGIRIHEL
jgi:hypothetical protein